MLTGPVTFDEAIGWAKSRGVVLPATFYGEMAADARGRAFTVSYITKLSQIQSVVDSLNTALEAGETLDQWRQRAGNDIGGLTDAHIETVFRNHHQQAYNNGRWRQFERNKNALPYLYFSSIADARRTDICEHRHGIIRRVDDPFWRRNSPQLHHNCRSQLIALTEAQAIARSRGGKGINQADPADVPPTGWGYKPDADAVATGLAEAIKSSVGNAPPGWFSTLMSSFAGIWGKLKKLLGG